MFGFKLLSCVILFVNANQLDAARILAFYSTPSISHHITFRPLTDELVRRGHEVTLITTDPFYPKGQAPANLTEIDLHDMSYSLWGELMAVAAKSKHEIIKQVFILAKSYVTLFEQQLLTPEVQEVLKKDKKHFDLIMTEACIRPALILSHVFDAPLIQVSSLGAFMINLEAIGAPTHTLLYPMATRRRLYNLTYWEKTMDVLTFVFLKYVSFKTEDNENEMFERHFGPNAPTVDQLRNNIHMLILNINPIWAWNMPVPPSLIYTGAIHLQDPKELPQDLKLYLDSSKHGVIYFSFGTNVRTDQITPEVRQKFISVLSKLPYDVLWKWDQDELPGRTENIKISKWLPQQDLLRHPKLKLFVTQGGLQSTDEAIAAGVPLIGVPMLGDQWYNVEKYVHFNIGLKIDIETFMEEDFRLAVTTVIEDERYRNNIKKLRAQMHDQPQTPMERGIWWIEHLLRHGGAKHLRAPAANMSYAEYYEVKLVSIIFFSLLFTLYIFVKIIIFLWILITRLNKKFKVKTS